MKTNISKKIAYWASVIVIGAVVGVALQFAKAWSEPTLPPPTNNIGAPITTGGDLQTKAGALKLGNYLEVAGGAILNSSGSATNGLLVHGNIGIGTMHPNGNKGNDGYLDVKDVYIRDAGKWASALTTAPQISCTDVTRTASTCNATCSALGSGYICLLGAEKGGNFHGYTRDCTATSDTGGCLCCRVTY